MLAAAKIQDSAYSHPPLGACGLELPIDHFRLLGVTGNSDAQVVLHTLQQRLDRPPEQGYTAETLQARAELLRASADLLADGPRRAEYEAHLTALVGRGHSLVPALDLPYALETGGLLLLLEAGQPLECFELASRALQPPNAPVLGSGREGDLTLLAGTACLAAAVAIHQQRRYELAATTLHQGGQLLQRMGKLPALLQEINAELLRLRPYRVLDLLSRELAAREERQLGLELLEQLVQERGGLEGEADPSLPAEQFGPFFSQIRAFLTVQEQVDLFSRWADQSPQATLLASRALTATGFAQRKPERIQAARQLLEASGQQAVEPSLACLYLLLGQVETGQRLFAEGANGRLKSWAAQQSGDPLAQLCAYCRDWLEREVLSGYRDLEADPDLEAYFADRDVQTWVMRLERSMAANPGSRPGSPGASRDDRQQQNPFADWTPSGEATVAVGPAMVAGDYVFTGQPLDDGPAFASGRSVAKDPSDASGRSEDSGKPDLRRRWRAGIARAGRSLPGLGWRPGRWAIAAAGAGLLMLIGVVLALRSRGPLPPAAPAPVKPKLAAPVAPVPAEPLPAAPKLAPSPQATLPLQAADPNEAQIQALLQAWLAAKAAVLAGGTSPQPLESLVRSPLVLRLQAERKRDLAASSSQEIKAQVEELQITERQAGRIVARVRLSYSERRLDASGQGLAAANRLRLTNSYVFGRDPDGIWRLVGFRPTN